MSPDAVANVVVELLGGERRFDTGSALRVGPDAVEEIAGDQRGHRCPGCASSTSHSRCVRPRGPQYGLLG
jgi:hypothetical protein